MISHLSLGSKDLARSKGFYDAVLGPLGYRRVEATKAGELAYGPPGCATFWLYEVKESLELASPGTHIAIQANSRERLHEAAKAAKDFGSGFTRDPGPHPDIAPDYYGAIFFDPDGHKLELVVEPAG